MVDAGGPGSHNIKPCTTLGLVDLGDTAGFDDPGKENQLYAFQLSEGTYKRKEINPGGGAQKFGDLSDVDVSNVRSDKPYQFVLTDDDTWIPYIDPIYAAGGWDLDFKLAQPYLNIGKNHELKKIQNSGKLLASYHTRRDSVVVKSTQFGYVVGVGGKKTAALRLNKEFDFGQPAPGSTIIIDIVLGERSDDFSKVVDGLRIKWNEKHVNKLLTIFIRVPQTAGEDPLVKFSLEGITKEVTGQPFSVDFLHLGPIQFKRLRYTTVALATTYLNKMPE